MSRGVSLRLSALAVLILSTGFFVGFASYAPIQRARSQLLLGRKKETEESRLAAFKDKAAPQIVSQTLGGDSWRLSDQKGKVVVAVFWSILCDECIRAIPAIDRIQATYGGRQDFCLVGVHRYPQRDVVSCFCASKGISWTQLYEDGEASRSGFLDAFGIRRTPTICLIDRQGKVRAIRAGLGDIEADIRRLLQ